MRRHSVVVPLKRQQLHTGMESIINMSCPCIHGMYVRTYMSGLGKLMCLSEVQNQFGTGLGSLLEPRPAAGVSAPRSLCWPLSFLLTYLVQRISYFPSAIIYLVIDHISMTFFVIVERR